MMVPRGNNSQLRKTQVPDFIWKPSPFVSCSLLYLQDKHHDYIMKVPCGLLLGEGVAIREVSGKLLRGEGELTAHTLKKTWWLNYVHLLVFQMAVVFASWHSSKWQQFLPPSILPNKRVVSISATLLSGIKHERPQLGHTCTLYTHLNVGQTAYKESRWRQWDHLPHYTLLIQDTIRLLVGW